MQICPRQRSRKDLKKKVPRVQMNRLADRDNPCSSRHRSLRLVSDLQVVYFAACLLTISQGLNVQAITAKEA